MCAAPTDRCVVLHGHCVSLIAALYIPLQVEAVKVEAKASNKVNAHNHCENMTLLVTRAMRCGIDDAAIMRAVDNLPGLPVNARDSIQSVLAEVMQTKARLAEQVMEKARLKAEKARERAAAEHEAKLAEAEASELAATARRRKEATGSLLTSLERAGARIVRV